MHQTINITFRSVLSAIGDFSQTAWVYLPSGRKWTLDSPAAVLESDEVPPEQEDDPDAGVPLWAKTHDFIQVLPVTTLQGIVSNAMTQRKNASLDDLYKAFRYYYDNDAYIRF